MFNINKKQSEVALIKVEAYKDGSGTTKITLYKGENEYTMFSYKSLKKIISKNNVELLALDTSTHNLLNATRIVHSLPQRKATGELLWA